jgi:CheY-like chemotaxis protein
MRLEQVVANLLLNAAKYTPDGGDITLAIEQQEVHASPLTRQAVVRVRDNGIGIEPALLNRVFELFFQGDQSLGRGQGGLGIGLSLVRTLVELHGGRVEAFSAGRGRGSEFVVYLPLAAAGKERAARAPESGGRTEVAAAQHGTQRVLVVDDNRDIAESTSKLLNLSGHETKIALSGEEALRVVGSFRPSTVLLDIGMPGMDGYQLCRELRRQVRGKQPRFVAVTGYGAVQNRTRAREAGFDEYLLKPVDLDTLNDLLKPSPGPQPG